METATPPVTIKETNVKSRKTRLKRVLLALGIPMKIRDDKAVADGGVTEADWQKIEELRRGSWNSLKTAVNQ